MDTARPLGDLLEDDDDERSSTTHVVAPPRKRRTPDPRPYLHDQLPEDWAFLPSFGADDMKGRGITISIKLPEELADAASSLIGRQGVPFETLKHMAREGMLLVVKMTNERLEQQDPHVTEFILGEQLARSQRQMQMRVEQFYTTIAGLRDQLVDLLNADALGQALDLLYVRRQDAKRHPDRYWRDRYTRAIDALPIVQLLDLIEDLPEEEEPSNGRATPKPSSKTPRDHRSAQ